MPLKTVKLNSESWFKISNSDSMRPFFMTLASDSNHWMFISSNGGLTAGRKDANYALFPYYTDDKITESAHTTGSKSIFQISKDGENYIWEPFSVISKAHFNITRNLYKNRYGNKILFEEVNHDLELTFRYEWNSSNIYGFVRNAELISSGKSQVDVKVIDGIQNILPYGVGSDFQNKSSNLVDAYKRSELLKSSGLGIYALSAIIVDRAEPSEALKANVVWSAGLDNPRYLLSSLQLDRFRNGEPVSEETDVKGEKGAYFVQSDFDLAPGESRTWTLVANVNQSQAAVVELDSALAGKTKLLEDVRKDVALGTENLIRLVAAADGLQVTSELLDDTRHFSNVLFNIMRGGIFDRNYQIEKKDFSEYLNKANTAVYSRNRDLIEKLNPIFELSDLKDKAANSGDPDLERLATEYLPLKFSRRHGDPSRPWNKFSINTRSEVDGSKILDYEGNWRDIFQNWEALVHSYPQFVEGMIYKFLNATTFDGYNPYRITKDGFDWEVVEPDDPWSFIGYWGDHQIIYLLKFLEFQRKYQPEDFDALFRKANFVYANVPYRIKAYADIVSNPKDTIEFDKKSDRSIRKKVADFGADGALATGPTGEIKRVSFLEKILATVLAKVSNFIPEAGIWMNTQRPEWNDANNALVGNGVSMVTLYYLRRFLKFFESLLDGSAGDTVEVSAELSEFFSEVRDVLKTHAHLLEGEVGNKNRKRITDALGMAGSAYREKVYNNGFSSESASIELSEIHHFVSLSLAYAEHAIRANRRGDNLYHAYNLMHISGDEIAVSRLSEMLEGQVAALSSGYLQPDEAIAVLDAMRKSALYREDQNSYMLYPNKSLPGFMEKNDVPKESVAESDLLQKMVADGDTRIMEKDRNGNYHFNGKLRNAGDLQHALTQLQSSPYADLAKAEEALLLDIYESVFDHKSFTGRSGTFFAYEGLGSIYWHMVSKLQFSVYEICRSAKTAGAKASDIEKLAAHFREIGAGIGVHKEPELYGAFPTDPYSHTPWHRGAQQPGMTGQVKEDVLVRFGELGVYVNDGKLHFQPFLLKRETFSGQAREFEFLDVKGDSNRVTIPENGLSFTYCKVPVVYHIDNDNALKVTFSDGNTKEFDGLETDEETARMVFDRSGAVKCMDVYFKSDQLL